MYIKRSIQFFIEKRKKGGVVVTDNVPIRMRILFSGKRIEFTSGHRIDAEKWDAKKQRVRNGCTNKLKVSAAQINADMLALENEIQKIFQEFEYQELMPTSEQIKDVFTSRLNQEEKPKEEVKEKRKKSFMEVYDEFCRQSSRVNNWTDATIQKFNAVRNHLVDFNKRLTFEKLNEKVLTDYVEFLRNKLQLRDSSIGKQLGYLKTFLKWATRKGYNTNLEFEAFRPKLKTIEKKVIFLDESELLKIQNCEIPATKQYLMRVRDVFLFCCFSGMRYSDVFNLRRCDIKGDVISFTTVKTADSLEVELNVHTRAILKKYEEYAFENDKALPVISNQKMNDYIRELAEMAGIDTMVRVSYYKGNERKDEYYPKYALLGTHTGRRTFICMALAKGIPVNYVMKWTGHSDFKAMKPYIDVVDEMKASFMSRLDDICAPVTK